MDEDELDCIEEIDWSDKILTSLNPNIFKGLNNLKILYLNSNQLTSLVEGTFNGLNNLTMLDLNSNKLTSLDPTIFNLLYNLTELNLNSNQLTSLDQKIFYGLNNLKKLHLNSNQLTSLLKSTFIKLKNLKELDLNSNKLTSLVEGTFNGLNRLEKLYLNSNQLTLLDPNVFNKLNNLIELDLNSNLLTSLHQIIFNRLNNLICLNINSNKLTSLDSIIFNGLNKLEKLYLNSNQLTSLNQNIFNGLNRLERLDLNSNQLKSLDENIFNGLNRLERLDLNSNQLTSLFEGSFNGLNNLWRLNLNSNKIKKLVKGAFNGLNKLEKLYLNSNQLTSLDENIFNGLQNLRMLDLNSNKLISLFEGSFNRLKKLENLHLNLNLLTSLDPNIFKTLNKLEKLYLNSNQITLLVKGTFNGLKNLKELDLNSNQLVSLDPNIFNGLNNLRLLSLNSNLLTSLDHNIFNGLNNLELLYLNSNKLLSLNPYIFNELNNLSELDLNSNKLRSIVEGTFNGLNKLEKLYLNLNQLTSLDPNIFNGLNNLWRLYLNSNQLTSLDYNIFNGLNNLEWLFLNSNKLLTLNPYIFNELKNLIELDLNSNQLTSLDHNIFNELNKLEWLYLNSNKLTSLDPNIFYGLNNLTLLRLNSNQLTSLDQNIFNGLKKLERLYLNSNQLTILFPNIFKELNNLIELDLNSNNLTILYPNIFNGLNKLEWLYLNSNQLTSLFEGAFNGLNNLLRLYLNSNHLSALDANVFFGLFNLKELDLNSNKLNSLDHNIFNAFNKLERLYLNFNQLTSLEVGSFYKLDNLWSLYLNSNQLTSLDPNIFYGLNNLKFLYLNSNQLTSLVEGTFNGLNNLTMLDLNSNQLTSLNPTIFNLLYNLTELNLNSNQLTSLDPNIFNGLNKLERLYFNFNKLNLLDFYIFNGLNNLQYLDISSNNLKSAIFYFSSPIQYIYLFFNNIRQCKLIFFNFIKYCHINLSSNSLDEFSMVANDCPLKKGSFLILAPERSYQFSFNLRFNSFKSFNYFKNQSLQFVDLRNNFIEIIQENHLDFIHLIDELNDLLNDGYIKEIDFHKINYPDNFLHLNNFNRFQNIPMFTIITGKNGRGKSTLLHFIENLLYQTIIESYLEEKEFLIQQENGKNYNTKKTTENQKIFSIPILLKLHDTIVSNDEIINKIKDKFRNHGNHSEGLSILSVYNLDSSLKFLSNKLEIINKHLKKNGYKYIVSKEKDTFYFKDNTFRITLKELSPGEQLMLQLYIWEFVLTRFPFKHKFVLLLDEPDAHLHPKAIHDFIAILKKVCMAGAQIIMTTHNPVTVSFVEKEKNLFVIKKQDKEHAPMYKIENDSKANIIRELTENVVMVNLPLKVIYQEGERDRNYYTWIHSSFSTKIKLKNQFHFEKSKMGKDGKGGCHIIRKLLSDLLDIRILNHFGIVDNDNIHIIHDQVIDLNQQYSKDIDSNDPNKRRRVLNIERHSIENYILDPIYFFFYIKKLFNSGVQFNFDNLEKLENDIVSDCFSRLKPNEYSKSKELNKFIQQYLIIKLTILDIYLDTNDAKYFTSEKVKKQISLLEKVFKVKYNDFCKIFLTSIVKNVAHLLFKYLIEYNKSEFSYKIFDGINGKQVAYKLIDLFYFLPSLDKINSVDFLFNIINDFDRMAKRFEEEIESSQNTDMNLLNLDELKKSVLLKSTLPIVKDYLNVSELIQNESDKKKSQIDTFFDILSKNGIIDKCPTVNRNQINTHFNEADDNFRDNIEKLISEFLNTSEKSNVKKLSNYSKLTNLIDLYSKRSNFTVEFEKDKQKALKELADYLEKNKLSEKRFKINKSAVNYDKLNDLLDSNTNQYQKIKDFSAEFVTKFDDQNWSKHLDFQKLTRLLPSSNTSQIPVLNIEEINNLQKELRNLIDKKQTDKFLKNKIIDVRILEAVVGFYSPDFNCSLENLLKELTDRNLIDLKGNIILPSSLSDLQKSSVENLVKLNSCHKNYETFQPKIENLRHFIKKFKIKRSENSNKNLLDEFKKFIDDSNFQIFYDYLKLKSDLDQQLIRELKHKLLDETVKCYFVDSANDSVFIEYPKILYRLQGHCVEEILDEIFFRKKEEKKPKKINLCEQVFKSIVEDGHRFIPREMKEIFLTIDNLIDEDNDKNNINKD